MSTPYIAAGAFFDGPYRYELWRHWRLGLPCVRVVETAAGSQRHRHQQAQRQEGLGVGRP